MAACTLLSAGATRGLALVPHQALSSARQRRKVAALSAVFCASVVAGNVSLRFIPVSFNQAISATDPAFTALFAALLQRRREARATYVALLPIVFGTALASGVRDCTQRAVRRARDADVAV
jgi:drug/metabolite transporter (DMT)-like permease